MRALSRLWRWLRQPWVRRALILLCFVVPSILFVIAVWLDPLKPVRQWQAVVEVQHCRPAQKGPVCVSILHLQDGRIVTVADAKEVRRRPGEAVTVQELKGQIFGIRHFVPEAQLSPR